MISSSGCGLKISTLLRAGSALSGRCVSSAFGFPPGQPVIVFCNLLKILMLTDADYIENGMSDLLADSGPAYDINIKIFNKLQNTITGWPGENQMLMIHIVLKEQSRLKNVY